MLDINLSTMDDLATLDYLKEYSSLLNQIDSIELSALDSICTRITMAQQVSEEQKQVHFSLLAEIKQIKEKIQQQIWMSKHLKILHELGQAFTKTFDQQQICQMAYDLASQVMPTDAFFIACCQPGAGEIDIPFAIDDGIHCNPFTLPLGTGNVTRVLRTGQTVHLQNREDIHTSPLACFGRMDKLTETAIYVPMFAGDQIRGVISAQSYQRFAYRAEHEELLQIIGMKVAGAIETAKLYQELYTIALHDELTSIKNYRAFQRDAKQLIEREAERHAVTLIMLDSDNLKQVNDRYGHHMGDKLIQRIAQAIQADQKPGEEVYRYAGDEFMIMVRDISIAQAEEKVERINHFLRTHPLHYYDTVIPVTVSVGIASHPEHACNVDALVHAADIALYQSKHNGKNCVTVFQGLRSPRANKMLEG